MQSWTATSAVESVIATLIDNSRKIMRQRQQQKEMIQQLSRYSLFCINASCEINEQRAMPLRQSAFKEQELKDVPHLSKDTLMPKELENEQPSISLQNISKISTTNKKISILSNKNSLSLSARPRSLINKSLINQKTKQTKEKEASQCRQLKSEAEIDDPEIQKLRERTEIRLHYDSQYRKLQMNHQKSFRSKSEMMTSFQQEEPASILTHDYEGQPIKSVLGEDKIKHYSLRMGIGPSKISARDNKKTLQPLQSEIALQKQSKQRQAYRNLKPMEMPLFQQPKLQPKQMSNVQSYKLNEYKKHFGRGYSRLDHLSKTIDYSVNKEQDDYFAEKRHLVDTIETNGMGSSTLKNSRVSRRLALPRLHGRYKVLDRYEQQ